MILGNDTGEVHKRWDLTSAPEVSEQLGNCAQTKIRLSKVFYASFLAYGCNYSFWGRQHACMTVIRFSATC